MPLRDPARTSRIIAALMAAARAAVHDNKMAQLVVTMGTGIQGVLDTTLRQAATRGAAVRSAAVATGAGAGPGSHQ